LTEFGHLVETFMVAELKEAGIMASEGVRSPAPASSYTDSSQPDGNHHRASPYLT